MGWIRALVEPDVWGRDGRGNYTSHLARTVISLCPSGTLRHVLSWLERAIQLSEHVCVGVNEGGQKACENDMTETRVVDDSAYWSTCRSTRQPCLCAFFQSENSSPGSLSSSHERSSELTSARLRVGLKSSESESASLTPAPLLWLWGSGDAPESNRKTSLIVLSCYHVCERAIEGETCLMCVLTAKVLVHILWEQVSWPPPSVLTQLFCCKRLNETYVNSQKDERQNPKHTHTYMHLLTHVPNLADLLLCVRILRNILCQISAVSSVAFCQLLQCLNKAHKGKVKDLKEYKPYIHKQTRPAWYNVCVYLAAVFILSPCLPGLCLLEEHVLLLSPCQEEKKEPTLWARLCLPLLCRPALGLGHVQSRRINHRGMTYVCVQDSRSCVFSWSTSLRRCSSSSRRSFELKLWKKKEKWW